MLGLLSRRGALVVSLLVVVAALWCALAPAPPSRAGTMKITDTALYARVVAQVRSGGAYYPTVTALQRQYEAPSRPFVTVRLPTLAWVQAALGPAGTRALALALLGANAIAWALVLRRAGAALIEQLGAALGVLAGGMLVFMPALLVWHEIWAGLLLGLALAAMCERRWWLALPLAALALAIRELALPFVLLAAALAAWDRDRRQFGAWMAVLAAFAVAMLVHRQMVAANLLPGDLRSPGWDALRGPVAFVDSLRDLTILGALPRAVAYAASLLPFLGWASLSAARARFSLLFFAGYALLLALFARADNYYWAELLLPAWFAGLAMVPRACVTLANALVHGARAGKRPPA